MSRIQKGNKMSRITFLLVIKLFVTSFEKITKRSKNTKHLKPSSSPSTKATINATNTLQGLRGDKWKKMVGRRIALTLFESEGKGGIEGDVNANCMLQRIWGVHEEEETFERDKIYENLWTAEWSHYVVTWR